MLDPGSPLREMHEQRHSPKTSSFIFNNIQNQFRAKLCIMYPFFLESGGHASTPLWTAKGWRVAHI
jgi:hypothetical protein